MIRLSVDYGYDLHTVSITEAIWVQIERGQSVVVEGQGFPVEGVMEKDQWAFNHGVVGAVQVGTETGRDVFEGYLLDAEVTVHHL